MIKKSDINASLVSDLVKDQFPQWAHLAIKPVQFDGWDNRTFHLGEDMLVRLPSAEAYSDQVDKEQYWLPRLAPRLPLPIPVPLSKGVPGHGYPWHWSVYRWLEGESATLERVNDLRSFANKLAQFLKALQHIDATDGPEPGPHNFYRGGALTTYDAETRRVIQALHDRIDTDEATAIWEASLVTTWQKPPIWIHGDVASGNLLVKEGQLSAVIDFGCSGIGDPACDLTIAWTFFSRDSRESFRSTRGLDSATWARARGWALWKSLITWAEFKDTDQIKARTAARVFEAVIDDHHQFS